MFLQILTDLLCLEIFVTTQKVETLAKEIYFLQPSHILLKKNYFKFSWSSFIVWSLIALANRAEKNLELIHM